MTNPADNEVRMPRLSDSMTEGTITRWLKHDGEVVSVGEEIVEVETDKATVPYAADMSGVLTILAREGETIAIGDPIARIGATVGRVKASPAARKLARERGLDLEQLAATLPGGRVTKAHVEQIPHDEDRAGHEAAVEPLGNDDPGETVAAEGPAEQIVPLSATQTLIARRMTEASRDIPAFSVSAEVDIGSLQSFRNRPDARFEPPSINAFVIKAAALALRQHPIINASFVDGGIRYHDRVNIGVAVATPDALIVPVIADADRKSIGAIADESRDLATRARAGSVGPGDLEGGTFTISNLGMFGIRHMVPIINPPQAAILGVGAAVPTFRPDSRGEQVVAEILEVTLVADHRIIYGAHAAAFLSDLREFLEHVPRLLCS